jgi:hypothetical protein
MHIQVIVSRKDISGKIKLSPQNTSRGKNAEHSKRMGQFDRSAFKQSGEGLFDELFDFSRNPEDTFSYANLQKNGTLEEREAFAALYLDHSSAIDSGSINPDFSLFDELSPDISDDIDDEQILGRNRRRQKKARTNTR